MAERHFGRRHGARREIAVDDEMITAFVIPAHAEVTTTATSIRPRSTGPRSIRKTHHPPSETTSRGARGNARSLRSTRRIRRTRYVPACRDRRWNTLAPDESRRYETVVP